MEVNTKNAEIEVKRRTKAEESEEIIAEMVA